MEGPVEMQKMGKYITMMLMAAFGFVVTILAYFFTVAAALGRM